MADLALGVLSAAIPIQVIPESLSVDRVSTLDFRPCYRQVRGDRVCYSLASGGPRMGSAAQTAGGENGAWANLGALPVDPMLTGLGGPTAAWTKAGLDRLADYLGEPLGYGSTQVPVPVNDVGAERAVFESVPVGCGLLQLRGGGQKTRVFVPVSFLRALYAAAGEPRWEYFALADADLATGTVTVARPSVNWFPGGYDARISAWAWRAMGALPVADGSNLQFPCGPQGWEPTYRYVEVHRWVLGWSFATAGGYDSLALRLTTHELADALLAAVGSASGPEREFALELQRQANIYLRVTVCRPSVGLDLDSWPEMVAAGANEAFLADLRLGSLTGAQLRSRVLAAKGRTIFVAPDTGSITGTERVDYDGTAFTSPARGTLTTTSYAALSVRPSLILGECVGSRADAVQALELLTGCSALDGAGRDSIGDPTDHPCWQSEHTLWASHLAQNRVAAQMAVAAVVLATRTTARTFDKAVVATTSPSTRAALLGLP